ncbi:MAG TPA: ATP-binding protein [Myxococcaceae bacterium]|nr:ATP-binding protein [Myxococcaceae bacterium]
MALVRDAVADVLRNTSLVPVAARSIVTTLPSSAGGEVGSLDVVAGHDLLRYLAVGLRVFSSAPQPALLEELHRCLTGGQGFKPANRVLTVTSDHHVVTAQETAHAMLRGLFKPTDCIRVVTAVSELARNIYLYAQTGEVRLTMAEEPDWSLLFQVVAQDRGPGIPNLDEILSGSYRSKTGLGKGLLGARTLLDGLDIKTGPGGTTIKGFKKSRPPDLSRNP